MAIGQADDGAPIRKIVVRAGQQHNAPYPKFVRSAKGNLHAGIGLRTVHARKRAYDIGSIFETTKAVHALGFNLEQKKTENVVLFSVCVPESSLVVAWTHLVGISERGNFRCIALDHRRLPRVQQFWDPQKSSG